MYACVAVKYCMCVRKGWEGEKRSVVNKEEREERLRAKNQKKKEIDFLPLSRKCLVDIL